MKRLIFNNIKNVRGWKSSRKIIVFAVDDYGNVRVHSKAARDRMNKMGLKIYSRFDAYDSIENTEDLEILFDTLTSFKDVNGKHPIFTAYAMPCNINFEKIEKNKFNEYFYELLPDTYNKLESINRKFKNTWNLWQQGISGKILQPQFHGREHLNLKVFNEKLKKKDNELMVALSNRSFTSISSSGHKEVKYTAAFDFWSPMENDSLKHILSDGIEKFKEVFGYSPSIFMPPSSSIHQDHFEFIRHKGINFIETSFTHNQHQGFGNFKRSYNHIGKKLNTDQFALVRNVVFEPTSKNNIDWIKNTINQIQTAFFWNKPAIISSHRVNFSGHIDEKNRKDGINKLTMLLKTIIKKWPDVEFMSTHELSELMVNSR